jgi:hypothetical protein
LPEERRLKNILKAAGGLRARGILRSYELNQDMNELILTTSFII